MLAVWRPDAPIRGNVDPTRRGKTLCPKRCSVGGRDIALAKRGLARGCVHQGPLLRGTTTPAFSVTSLFHSSQLQPRRSDNTAPCLQPCRVPQIVCLRLAEVVEINCLFLPRATLGCLVWLGTTLLTPVMPLSGPSD